VPHTAVPLTIHMEILNFIKRLHDESIRLSRDIVFDKRHPRHLYLVGLYGSIIELTGSLTALIELKYWTGAPPVFRSLLEAYVEFANLQSDAKYDYYMEANNHEQWLKVLKEARDHANPFLEGISKYDNLDDQIQEHEKELKKLKAKGYNPLNVFERFEKAGMVKEYRSLYSFLSGDSHSDIRALIDRHLEINNNDFTVHYYKDKHLTHLLPILDSTAGLLVNASQKIHQYFETESESELENWVRELNEIRSRYNLPQ
jgi:hypothetical protein